MSPLFWALSPLRRRRAGGAKQRPRQCRSPSTRSSTNRSWSTAGGSRCTCSPTRESDPTKEETMLDHVAIPVRDLEASRKFYEPLFEGLGAKVVMEWPGLTLFGTDDGMVALRQSEEVMPMHIAFRADRSA